MPLASYVHPLAVALGGRLRRTSSRREAAAPQTPKIPATELMPGLVLDAPTIVDQNDLAGTASPK